MTGGTWQKLRVLDGRLDIINFVGRLFGRYPEILMKICCVRRQIYSTRSNCESINESICLFVTTQFTGSDQRFDQPKN